MAAIQLEFLNLIVPVQRIRDLYPGGWSGFIADNAKRIGRTIWYSPSLVRAGGAMDPEMVDALIERWIALGFTATEVVDGRKQWKDFVLVDAFGFTQHDCPWITVAERVAWLRATERGEVVGRDSFQ
jgi:hypothetical protein